MTGVEWIRLPNLPEGSVEEQLRAIRNYLYQLAEQLQMALSGEEKQETDQGVSWEKVLESAELAQGLLALTGRRFDSRYIGVDSWEADRRRNAAEKADALCRLSAVEDRKQEAPRPCPVAFRQEGQLGIQRQEGDSVCFAPLEIPEALLKKSPDGHWRLESE